MTARLAVLLLALSALLLGACSQVVTVREGQLEEDIARHLEYTGGNAPDEVDCPGGLEAEEGNEIRCTLAAGEERRSVTVTVTGLDDTDVDYDIEVEGE
jgi:hypothetical protein